MVDSDAAGRLTDKRREDLDTVLKQNELFAALQPLVPLIREIWRAPSVEEAEAQLTLACKLSKKFFGHPLVDCGNTAEKSDLPKEWSAPLITLYDHLKYKFVISLEGTDVASNLKWVMSSNSVAVMPRPKYESWFMEGRLQPGVHYIEIKDDYSDLEDKIQYYSTHVEEAEAIIRNAHAFVEQFRDKEREELISILVLEKYFRHTKQ